MIKNRNTKKEKMNSTQQIDPETLQMAIVEIAAESWRYECALHKVLKHLDIMEAERFLRQYEYFTTKVNRAVAMAGLKVLDLSGQMYDAGLPIQVMNLEEFDEEDELIITKVIEPVILLDKNVVKTGVVMVDRVKSE